MRALLHMDIFPFYKINLLTKKLITLLPLFFIIEKENVKELNKKIIFIGGIHGVGKSSFCKELSQRVNAKYISASEIIEGQKQIIDKRVRDISDNQKLLIEGLKNISDDLNLFILDGHYTLLNSDKKVERVPLETFKQLSPICLILKIEKEEIIQKRLFDRDRIKYEISLLSQMQNQEIGYFRELCREFNLEGILISEDDINYVIKKLLQKEIINESFT